MRNRIFNPIQKLCRDVSTAFSSLCMDRLWDNNPVSRAYRQCNFFDLALLTVDNAKVNKRGGLRRPFQRFVHESPVGFIERWDEIPFDGRPAPRYDPLDGYIFFVDKVFELLGHIYRVKNEKFKWAVKRAKELAGRRDNELFRHADRPGNDPKEHDSHQEILEVWNCVIRTLERTVANY